MIKKTKIYIKYLAYTQQEAKQYWEILDPDRVTGTEVEISQRGTESMECLAYLLPPPEHRFDLVLAALQAQVLNTYDRTMKFIEYDGKLSGKVFHLSRLPLEEQYKLCDFEIQP